MPQGEQWHMCTRRLREDKVTYYTSFLANRQAGLPIGQWEHKIWVNMEPGQGSHQLELKKIFKINKAIFFNTISEF